MSSSTTPKKKDVDNSHDASTPSSSKKRCIELVSSSNSIERMDISKDSFISFVFSADTEVKSPEKRTKKLNDSDIPEKKEQ